MSVFCSPFKWPFSINTDSIWGIDWTGQYAIVRPNGTFKQLITGHPTAGPLGFGLKGRYLYCLNPSSEDIYRIDTADNSRVTLANSPLSRVRDLAINSTHIFIAGDTANFEAYIEKYTLDGTFVSSANLIDFGINVGSLGIAANDDGFILTSNNRLRIFNTNFVQIANQDSQIVDNLNYYEGVAATKDRLFATDKDSFSAGAQVRIHVFNSSTGAKTATVLPSNLTLDQTGAIAATESNVYFFDRQGTYTDCHRYARAGDVISNIPNTTSFSGAGFSSGFTKGGASVDSTLLI